MLELQITKEYLGLRDAPRLPGAAVRGGAERRHHAPAAVSGRQVIDGSLGCRRAGIAASPTPAPIATGAGRVRMRQLVRVRPARVEPGARRPRHVADEWLRMTFTNDAAFVAAGEDDDARVARGGGGLHDAARPASPDGARPSLRSRAVGRRRPARRLDVRLLPPRRRAAASASIARPPAATRSAQYARAAARPLRPASSASPTTTCSGSTTCRGITGCRRAARSGTS